MMGLGGIELIQKLQCCRNFLTQQVGLRQSGQYIDAPLLLLIPLIEYGRTVLGAMIGSLGIQLGRVVRHGKKNLRIVSHGHLLRIICDFDGFGVASIALTDLIVKRLFRILLQHTR